MSSLESLLYRVLDLRNDYSDKSKRESCEMLATYYRGRADGYDVVCDILKEEIWNEKKSR